MSAERFTEHLQFPQGYGLRPAGGSIGAAGGAVCGDLVSIALRVEGGRVAAAGFEASGCGAVTAAGSAAVALVEGASVLDAARVGTHQIAAELGGLSPGKLHAAELAADALHRALGSAARAGRCPRARPAAHARRHERRRGLGGRRAALRPRGPRGGRRHARAVGG